MVAVWLQGLPLLANVVVIQEEAHGLNRHPKRMYQTLQEGYSLNFIFTWCLFLLDLTLCIRSSNKLSYALGEPYYTKEKARFCYFICCQAFQLVSSFPNEGVNYASFCPKKIYVTEFKCRRFDRSLLKVQFFNTLEAWLLLYCLNSVPVCQCLWVSLCFFDQFL